MEITIRKLMFLMFVHKLAEAAPTYMLIYSGTIIFSFIQLFIVYLCPVVQKHCYCVGVCFIDDKKCVYVCSLYFFQVSIAMVVTWLMSCFFFFVCKTLRHFRCYVLIYNAAPSGIDIESKHAARVMKNCLHQKGEQGVLQHMFFFWPLQSLKLNNMESVWD